MIPKEGEGLIFFKNGSYVALKVDIDSLNLGYMEEAVKRCKEALERVVDGKASSNSSK